MEAQALGLDLQHASVPHGQRGSPGQRQALSDALVFLRYYGAGFAAGNQSALAGIAPVDKGFGNEGYVSFSGFFLNQRFRHANQRQTGSGGHLDEQGGEIRIILCVIIQGTMRLEMSQRQADLFRYGCDIVQLTGQTCFQIFQRDIH